MSPENEKLWARLVECYKNYLLALQDFSGEDIDRVSMIREGFARGERGVAVKMAGYLKSSEAAELFESFVSGASTGNSYVIAFRQLILGLPREWVLERIEDAAEPYLADGTEDEYRRFLELYLELDDELTTKLAKRAGDHADSDIREAGEEFLKVLQERIA